MFLQFFQGPLCGKDYQIMYCMVEYFAIAKKRRVNIPVTSFKVLTDPVKKNGAV